MKHGLQPVICYSFVNYYRFYNIKQQEIVLLRILWESSFELYMHYNFIQYVSMRVTSALPGTAVM